MERFLNWYAGLRPSFQWAGGALALAAVASLCALGWRSFSYHADVRAQAPLLDRIHALEQGLDSSIAGAGATPERAARVHRLLAAERKLFRIRARLEPADRAPTYRDSLGADVQGILEELGKTGFVIPESFIRSVREEIGGFTKAGGRATLERCFARKPRFESLILAELKRKRLPPEFLYIAMQESLLDSAAQSGNEARGLWQMMPETAREFGMRVPDDWKAKPARLDPRTRPRPATRAAAEYLRALSAEFGDPALCMAAYNAGAGKMRKSLRGPGDPDSGRDYWFLYRMGMMSPETREYVPKIIAMILIDRNRARYGFGG